MIIHVDMDAFYASIEQRDNPSLRGKPLVVGGSASGRGVVSAASYEARKFGIHSAMSAKRALQLCPEAIFIRPRIDYYAQISHQIRAIFERYTPLVEPLSLDEAFLDVTHTSHLFGGFEAVGKSIKFEIKERLGLVASVGIAPNKFIAKIASDLKKPDALLIVLPENKQQFLDPLPVTRLWGVGTVTSRRFTRYGIDTIAKLRKLELESAKAIFGDAAEHFMHLANGLDDRVVTCDRTAKSISNETTFSEDIGDPRRMRVHIVGLVEKVGRRVRFFGRKARTFEIKVRFADFSTITRSLTLQESTDETQEILRTIDILFQERVELKNRRVRLLGVAAMHFDRSSVVQQSLFVDEAAIRNKSMDTVTDSIIHKFGKQAIQRAAGWEPVTELTDKRSPGKTRQYRRQT